MFSDHDLGRFRHAELDDYQLYAEELRKLAGHAHLARDSRARRPRHWLSDMVVVDFENFGKMLGARTS